MPNYKVLIRDNSNQDQQHNQYSAEQHSPTKQEAINALTEYYANECDTDPNQIEILSIVKL